MDPESGVVGNIRPLIFNQLRKGKAEEIVFTVPPKTHRGIGCNKRSAFLQDGVNIQGCHFIAVENPLFGPGGNPDGKARFGCKVKMPGIAHQKAVERESPGFVGFEFKADTLARAEQFFLLRIDGETESHKTAVR
ncbi:MAG: hypothetical protein K0R65_1126 [Crocinitomicaceae bacterium]|nr:hypothetical protein [Crocinitomicaceae bacterium]